MHWDFALILIFLATVVPWLGRRRIRQLMQLPDTTKLDRLALYASTVAFQWLAVAVVLWRTHAHGIPPAQLGQALARPSLTVSVSVALALLILANQLLSLRRLVTRSPEIHGFLPQLALKVLPQDDVERLAFLALVSTVALCEELIYRGFIQRVFQDWSGGAAAAGVLASASFFALAHLYQGRRGLASTFSVGILFSVVRAWTSSLLPPMIAHFIADLVVGWVAPARLRAALAEASKESEHDPRTVKPRSL
jgi:membrane protease YdiL (CAAX protease family)